MSDRREELSAALDAIEETPAVEQVVESTPVETTPVETQEVAAEVQRARDEQGRFAREQALQAAQQPAAQAPVVEPQPVQRPSTWKKEYWPLYDKLATGQPLTADEAKKLADYTNQRENEFKSGVSTYKAEAESAREIQQAMAPFQADLQKYGIKPGQWIANLGNAHRTLALGSPQERLHAFQRLAREYQVPLNLLQTDGTPQQLDPQLGWLTNELNQTKGQLQKFLNESQQREHQDLMNQIEVVKSEKGSNGQLLRPHFDEVKAQMSGLLQAGIAQDLQDAYERAVWMSPNLREQLHAEQAKQSAAQRVAQAQATVQKAKAAAVSPRSASPSATGDTGAKGRRAVLEEQMESLGGGRV